MVKVESLDGTKDPLDHMEKYKSVVPSLACPERNHVLSLPNNPKKGGQNLVQQTEALED